MRTVRFHWDHARKVWTDHNSTASVCPWEATDKDGEAKAMLVARKAVSQRLGIPEDGLTVVFDHARPLSGVTEPIAMQITNFGKLAS